MITDQFRGKPIEVPIHELNFAPGPFCMSYVQDLSRLERSIHQIGLLHRPYVVKNHSGRLDIVTGYRRLRALCNMGETRLPCLELTGCNLSGLELLLLNFYENLSIRLFNAIEKGMILKRLHHYLNPDKILSHYMHLLDLPAYDEILNMYMGLDKYQNEFKQAVANGVISLKSVRLINRMQVDDISGLFRAIIACKFNQNQQIRFIEYVHDLSIMKEKTVERILADPGLTAIVHKGHDNIPQKAKQCLNYLKSKRFPRLTEYEKRFRADIERLHLPPGSRIKSDPGFEENDLCLEVLFQNGPDLIGKLEAIKDCSELAHIQGTPKE